MPKKALHILRLLRRKKGIVVEAGSVANSNWQMNGFTDNR
jgi:hypothetical protein